MKKILLFLLLSKAAFGGGFIKQSTATTINLGPFLSAGVPQTGLTVSNMTVRLIKQSDTSSTSNVSFSPTASGGSNDCVHAVSGVYNLELTASNTDTVGRLKVVVTISGADVVSDEYTVVGPDSWDTNITGNVASVADIYDAQTSTLTTSGSIGKLFVDNLDQKVSYGSALRIGTAQAGGTSTITLDASASSTTNYYNLKAVSIISGTGAGQSAIITAYNGSTKVATILGSWLTNPTSGSVFKLEDASTAVLADNIIAAAKIASGAITSTKFSTDAIDSNTFAQAAADKVWGSGTRTITALGTDAITAASVSTAASNKIRDNIYDSPVEGSYTLKQVHRIISAVLAGKSTSAPGTVTFRDLNDTVTRVSATVSGSSRTAVTLTP